MSNHAVSKRKDSEESARTRPIYGSSYRSNGVGGGGEDSCVTSEFQRKTHGRRSGRNRVVQTAAKAGAGLGGRTEGTTLNRDELLPRTTNADRDQ